MGAIETLKLDFQEGRLNAERLLDLIGMQQRQLQEKHQQLQTAQQQLQTANQRIEELEKKLGMAGPAKLDEP